MAEGALAVLLKREITAGEDLVLNLESHETPISASLLRLYLGDLPTCAPATITAETLTVDGETTAKLAPGAHRWELWAQSPDYLLASGTVRILASLRAGHDLRSHNAQVLAALKEAMLRLAQEDEVSVTIHGRAVTFQDPEKIQRMIDLYQAKVNAETTGSLITSIPVRLGRR